MPMDEAAVVLESIRAHLAKQGPGVVRAVEVHGGVLVAFDGAVRVVAVVHRDAESDASLAHCHVIAEIGLKEHAQLEACVVGVQDDRGKALEQAGEVWVTAVAAPLFSLLNTRAVMGATHFEGSEPWGVSGCHGFAGPTIVRRIEKGWDVEVLHEAKVFDGVAELAPPGLVHLAKVTLEAKGKGVWSRAVEIDGHAAMYTEEPWAGGPAAPGRGPVSRFAVFHYGDRAGAVKEREKVDDAIRRFVAAFGATGELDRAEAMLAAEGVEADLAHRVSEFTPTAFGHEVCKRMGVVVSPEYTRVRQDGGTEKGLLLMHEPVYARSVALMPELMAAGRAEAVKELALTSGAMQAVNGALQAGHAVKGLVMMPTIVPERGASAAAMGRAVEELQKGGAGQVQERRGKAWWQFWR